MARPSKYNAKFHVPWITGLAQRGLTVEEIALELDIAKSTLSRWIAENDELRESIKKGRGFADTQVETSLYKRATGYKITKKKTIVQTASDGSALPARVEINEEDVPPDTTACIFWLKNRCPERWRDRTENVVTGNLTTQQVDDDKLKEVPDELLEQVLNKINGNE